MASNPETTQLAQRIFEPTSSKDQFDQLALEVFKYQAEQIPVYKTYIQHLGRTVSAIKSLEEIPFLPIGFFKSHPVIRKDAEPKVVFKSSGTSGQVRSRHLVEDVTIYQRSLFMCFEEQYGALNQYEIFALLPSYLEQGESSLVYMVNQFFEQHQPTYGGFYLNNFDQLAEQLAAAKNAGKRVLLIGVTYALLDFIDSYAPALTTGDIVMETGGMKGRKKEMIRPEVHTQLAKGFGLEKIHSEYGMTELLSQCYSSGDGIFNQPSTLKVLIRDLSDPFAYVSKGRSGAINVIDLSNINSCSFIETADLGRQLSDEQFEVLGRLDQSEARGCGLMYTDVI